MSPYGTKALTPNTPFKLRAPYEDGEGAKLSVGRPVCEYHLIRKAFLYLEKFTTSQ